MIKDTLTYDIVGSFLRPAEIKEARKAYKDGKITKEELTQAEDLAIASLVEKEVAHGLKYVTDGEFRRRWWQFGLAQRNLMDSIPSFHKRNQWNQ